MSFKTDFSYKDAETLTRVARNTSASSYKNNDITFKAFHNLCKTARSAYLAKKAEMQAQIDRINRADMYSNGYKQEQIFALKNAYQAERDEEVHKLKSMLNNLVEVRKTQATDYVTAPPDDAQIRLLQSLQMRDDISTSELELFIKRCADNYQSLATLRNIAQKCGKDFILPFSIDDYNADLDIATKRCNAILDTFDADERALHYLETEFFGDYQNSSVTNLFSALDDSIAVASGEKSSVVDILKDISSTNQAIAKETGDTKTKKDAMQKVAKINNFVNQHYSDLTTPEERRRHAMKEAGEMLDEILREEN